MFYMNSINVTLQFLGEEKLIYDCRVQLEPSALKFSEVNLYVTQTRLVIELEDPLTIEISEIMELNLERYYGEQFIKLRYKDIRGVHEMKFVCTGFGGIISNISKTSFLFKLIGRLREGMDPRDLRFIVSGSSLEIYKPWTLLGVMLASLAFILISEAGCTGRLTISFILVSAYVAFSFTEVNKLLLGSLRWPVFTIVVGMIVIAMAILGNSCSTVEVMQSSTIVGKSIISGNYCLDISSNLGNERICMDEQEWKQNNIGDTIGIYYLKGPLFNTMVEGRYDDAP